MKQLNKMALAVGFACASMSVQAANHVADGRGNAMGNTGVASADYLVAPFYNPALGANFREHDDFGLLLPAVGVNARDTDESLATLDDLQDSIEEFESNPSPAVEAELNGYLDDLTGNKPVVVTAGAGIAIALPIEAVSTNLFTRGYVEVIASADIDDNPNTTLRYENSTVEMAAFGYAEIGISFAKEFVIQEERVSFGISPKYQELTTYSASSKVEDFDLDDYDQSEMSETAFNFDIGAVWYRENFRVGFAIKDVLAQEVAFSQGTTGVYELNPQATLGFAYAHEYFTLAADADLTSQERFKNVDDDTQFIRFGIEGDAWGWAQLRAGYEIDIEDTLDNSLTAGIGISPWDVVSLDLAGSYAGDNQFGASGNLAFTF
ncbi:MULTISPECIES: conjugal transfer protein TraF [Vibrio]|uniref:conjugal transfer protein TraF n=1 Tax=Vibrio TaxID=662 RepID=UPI001ABEFC1C|nr:MULTISPECIES: conjugal transfer protein TraF [Vibrio]